WRPMGASRARRSESRSGRFAGPVAAPAVAAIEARTTAARALTSELLPGAARHAGDDAVLALQPLQGGHAHGPADVVLVRAVAGPVFHELAAVHQAVAVDDQLGAGGAHQVVLAAHDDRLLRAGVHAEAAVHAAQQVDLEARGVLL